jgi:hypothetical protein
MAVRTHVLGWRVQFHWGSKGALSGAAGAAQRVHLRRMAGAAGDQPVLLPAVKIGLTGI